MSRCFCLSTPTDEITSLHQNYHYHGSVELNNSSTVGNFKLCLFSLPLHCCSTVFTDVTSLTSTLVTLLAKRAYISEDYCWKLAMLRERDTEALWSPVRTAVLQQNVLAKSLDNKRFEIEFNTTMALAIDETAWFCRWSVGQSYETLKVMQHRDYGFLVWRRVVRQTRH